MYYKFKLFGRKYKVNVNTGTITSGWGERYTSYPFFPLSISDDGHTIKIGIGLFKGIYISEMNTLMESNAKGYAAAMCRRESQYRSFEATLSNVISMFPIRFINKSEGIANRNGCKSRVYICDNRLNFMTKGLEEFFFSTYDCRDANWNRLDYWPEGTEDDIFRLAMAIDCSNAANISATTYWLCHTKRDKWYVSSANGTETMRRIWDSNKKWIGIWPEFNTEAEAKEFIDKLKRL